MQGYKACEAIPTKDREIEPEQNEDCEGYERGINEALNRKIELKEHEYNDDVNNVIKHDNTYSRYSRETR